jgi:hypothetical protein
VNQRIRKKFLENAAQLDINWKGDPNAPLSIVDDLDDAAGRGLE